MVSPFNRWTEQIIAAEDAPAREALVGEISRWRAGCLTDVSKQRDAAHALARLYMLLGRQDNAVQEGQTLMSLCQIPPEASKEEWMEASAFLKTLGGVPPRRAKSGKQKRERESKKKPPRGDSMEQFVRQVLDGKHSDVRAAIKGKKGHSLQILRIWMTLQDWLQQEPGPKRDKAIQQLEHRLRRQLAPQVQQDTAPKTKAAAPPEHQKPNEVDRELSELLGRPVPRRRDSRIRALEKHILEQPESSDAVAAAALRHHVALGGLDAPAPWLIGVVGRALTMTSGADTRAQLKELEAQKAVCVEPFVTEAFDRGLVLIQSALKDGWSLKTWRRGVLPRVETVLRKIWTIRLEKDQSERMVAIAPNVEEPYPEGVPATLATRLKHLCSATLLIAPGVGNDQLIEAVAAVGLSSARDVAAKEALEALGALQVTAEPAPAQVGESSLEMLNALLRGEEAPALEAVVSAVSALKRARDGFKIVGPTKDGSSQELSGDRIALLLTALHRVVPEGSRLLEGTTLAVRALALEPDCEQFKALLHQEPEASRYGGAGIDGVVAVVRSALGGGWALSRVLKGTTRRERRDNEVLETIGLGADEIWRLVFTKGEHKGEVIYLESLSPEGRAALPQLMRVERNRVVVLPIEPELLEWYREIEGPEPVGWSGEDGAAVAEAMTAWEA